MSHGDGDAAAAGDHDGDDGDDYDQDDVSDVLPRTYGAQYTLTRTLFSMCSQSSASLMEAGTFS